MLCTSGFVDDVMFLNSWPCDALSVFVSDESIITSIPTKFCSAIKICKYISLVAQRRRSLPSTIALLYSIFHARKAVKTPTAAAAGVHTESPVLRDGVSERR